MKAAPLIGISRHRLSTDGEGVTTLVAFHGCPLRCKYCLNPQSLHSEGIWKNYDCEQLYEEVRQDELFFLATNGNNVQYGSIFDIDNKVVANLRHNVAQSLRQNYIAHGLEMVHANGNGSFALAFIN